jgi:hypothetical protein
LFYDLVLPLADEDLEEEMEGARRADLRTTLSSRVQLPATSRPKLQPTRRVTDRSAHIFYQCSRSETGVGLLIAE